MATALLDDELWGLRYRRSGGWSGDRDADPTALVADRGYDSKAHRQALRTLGIRPVIARRKTAHGSGLGSQRWVVERTLLLATATPAPAHPL